MPTVTLTDPVAGNVVTAGLHTANNAALRSALNAGLDTANWASGRIFAPSKLMQEAATKFQGLNWNGTDWVPSTTPQVYGTRLAAIVDVNTTAVETTLYSQAIAANDMSTNKRLIVHASGDFLHNNGAADTLTFRMKFGTKTLASSASTLGGVASVTRRPWFMTPTNSFVANQLATNVQDLAFQVAGTDTSGSPFTLNLFNNDTGTEDTTAIVTFSLTVQWSASSVNNSWRIRECFLLLV